MCLVEMSQVAKPEKLRLAVWATPSYTHKWTNKLKKTLSNVCYSFVWVPKSVLS